MDVFTHQKILNYENNLKINKKAEYLMETAIGPEPAKENLSNTINLLYRVSPRAYEKVITETEKFVFMNRSMKPFLARANLQSRIIEIDPIFSKSFNSLEEEIYFASILVYETEHLKNFRNNDGYVVNLFNYTMLRVKCNPLTNYQYFSHIQRAMFTYSDEWCAQISEVKFFKQFNFDYTGYWMKNFEDN